ncbi:monocarboxylate uptake permease MctP [Streptacidiphilus carbonis]|jgi:solute:Na+ symporter, SSS family|uniref:monocarboxylate uptake permease MctP n=1 Tax=Streptacidiphilus carbonis TaxID=105422 RepID=UPI0005AB2EF3|nr:sodium:solute symporter [Streptacidiphilus carbonis]
MNQLASGGTNAVSLTVFLILFVAVTGVGFVASRWRRAEDALHLDEWGLGGRGFGTVVSWFLLGGDLYTAYTFIAVPALIYGAGAAGFYAVPYTILVWPMVFLFLPRLWSVARSKGYVTLADFARGRYGSRSLALAVALTGILATMPYIALQLVGIQAVLDTMGVGGSSGFGKDLPLLIAFAVLAAYTYSSGLRAPALIAFVKDTLVYIVVIVAVIYIPIRLGGYGHVFHDAATSLAKTNPATGKPKGSLITGPKAQWSYATLALGSAMALFMYPHSATGVLASKDRTTVRRNLAVLPAYSLMLGLLSLLGFMAISAGVGKGVKGFNAQLAVPELFQQMFPSWFAGVAFAAVGIGALVPAAIMSIAAANLFTRNVYREYFKPDATPAQETRVAKLVSLVVKLGALGFVLGIDKQFSINLQLLGGIWILQTFPAIVAGLFSRWFHHWALLVGWAAGMAYGTYEAYNVATAGKPNSHFGGSAANIPVVGQIGYIGLTAFVLNLVVSVVLTLAIRAAKPRELPDETVPGDYLVESAPLVPLTPETAPSR